MAKKTEDPLLKALRDALLSKAEQSGMGLEEVEKLEDLVRPAGKAEGGGNANRKTDRKNSPARFWMQPRLRIAQHFDIQPAALVYARISNLIQASRPSSGLQRLYS